MKQIEKITNIVEIVLMAIGAVLVVLGYIYANDDPLADGSWVDRCIIWTVIIAAVAFLCAIASEAISAASDPKTLVKSGIALVGAIAVLAIFWALSSDTPLPLVGYEGDQNEGGWLKISDTGLFTVYLALAAGIVSIVVSEVYQLFR